MIKDLYEKQMLIDSGAFKDYKKASYAMFNHLWYRDVYPNEFKLYYKWLDTLSENDLRILRNLKAAEWKRCKRARDFIANMLHFPCVFLTLTFTNDLLASTTSETRKRYVTRYLKSYSPVYIANIDYGKKNGREHYHALALDWDFNYDEWHKYGAIKGLKVHIPNEKALSKYLVKFANHATKETTKSTRVIYSKCIDTF